MARYLADTNKVVFFPESGTYAVASGVGTWIGYVQTHDLSEETGIMDIRYQGTSTRNISLHVDGPIDNTGTLSYYPQDMRMLGYALGSIVDTSGTQSIHVMSEANSNTGNAYTSGTTNPFISFTLEDSHSSLGAGRNFIRTANGCIVDTFTLTSTQGEIITVDVDYVAQNVVYSSGASTAVTEVTSLVPLMWSHVKVHIPSGTVYPEVTDVKFTIKNNVEAPHYLNGSRVIGIPYPTNRDYSVELTQEIDSSRLNTLYAANYKSGTDFNMMLEINASAGSQAYYIILSGCEIEKMDNPSPVDGTDINSITIVPKNCIVAGSDLITRYNPY